MFDLELILMLIILAWVYLVPLLAIVAFFMARVVFMHRRQWLMASLVFAVLWIPMLGNVLGIWNAWWIIPTGNIRSGVDLPGYRVEFVSNSIFSDASEYFDIIRDDGKFGFVNIDGDANACRDFHTRQEGSRVYFVCNNEPTPSYVDVEQALVYAGWQGMTTRLADLEYTDQKPE